MGGLYNLLASAILVTTGAVLLALGPGRKVKIEVRGLGETAITTSGIAGIIMIILGILVL
ncbi:MAG: hypothetical protein OEZ40_08255 [Candidatus Bathyarchaeota archaeon]|nr:hypothetical protein [Candidatus Bathyarchaeota archaeon]